MGVDVVLVLIFLVLKLTGVIAWSWWWVFSPLLISVALGVVWVASVFAIVETNLLNSGERKK